jgi:metal-responsive CopG/Arc/MetJ family transcriptional regulator
MEEKKKISIYLPMDIYNKFKNLVDEKGKSMNEALNQCVKYLLTNYDEIMTDLKISGKIDFEYIKSMENRISDLEKKVKKLEKK